mmetsp:Transcript_48697/g.155639  ORF Transcript_48697/g.155639 Transcript_48697/m.155639 type:complete len:248 (+) Transcript_48697:244-987(+)
MGHSFCGRASAGFSGSAKSSGSKSTFSSASRVPGLAPRLVASMPLVAAHIMTLMMRRAVGCTMITCSSSTLEYRSMKRGSDSAQPPSCSGAFATRDCACTHQATFQAEDSTTRARSMLARVNPGRTLASKATTHSSRQPRRQPFTAPTKQPSASTRPCSKASQWRKALCCLQPSNQQVRHTPARFMTQQQTQMSSAVSRKQVKSVPRQKQRPTKLGYAPADSVSTMPSWTSASMFSRVTWRSASRRD